MRSSTVVIEGFYRDAQAVRNYALRQRFYTPYQSEEDLSAGQKPTWWASQFREFQACPFKSSTWLCNALEQVTGETLDVEHWRAGFPVDAASRPQRILLEGRYGCLWNCSFHVKPDNGQQLGDGVHNHVTDSWNSVGPEGWAGIIYLNPVPPLEGGLHLWRNIEPLNTYDWMTPARNWELVDRFGNLFNRLLLVRGDVPHSGAVGWGDDLESGRLYQTFFFRTQPRQTLWPVSMPEIGA